MLRAWQEAGGAGLAALKDVDLSALEGPQAQALMLQLAKYPEMLTAAAEGEAPHDVTFYLRDLAASYHSYYDGSYTIFTSTVPEDEYVDFSGSDSEDKVVIDVYL